MTLSSSGILFIVVLGIIKILMTCLPLGTVEWLLKKFELHEKVTEETTVVLISGEKSTEEKKRKIIQGYNEALFLKKHYIFPGNEHLFLNPKDKNLPITIHTKKGKKPLKLSLFIYDNHIDIVKEYGKKMIAYSIYNEEFQKMAFADK